MKIFLSCLLAASAIVGSAQSQPTPHKVFIVDGVIHQSSATPIMGSVITSSGDVHTAPGVISEIMKKCPGTIALTTNPTAAEYTLNPQMKGSTLSNAAGDVLYVSPAIKVKNIAKDVCAFIESQKH